VVCQCGNTKLLEKFGSNALALSVATCLYPRKKE